jgi:DNA-binding NarL/FixJ family response regulator
MRCLDEATAAATAGEVKELHTVGVVCCWQIFACERVRDYDRAAQWCARVEEFTKRWPLRPLTAICRSQYAGVLIWRGEWAAAEAELATAAREFEQTRPPLLGQALVRLGELRLAQGRLDEAAQLFQRAGEQPRAKIGRAALDLERGAADESAAQLERFLTSVGDAEPTIRAGALEVLVHAHVARGDAPAAARAGDELRRIAQTLGTPPLAASVASAEGALLRLAGDPAGAVGRFEAAVTAYEASRAPLEAARARLDLAQMLAATKQAAGAEREARLALETFKRLGAAGDTARAQAWLAHGKSRLTGRQKEILRLVAQGLTNPEIAARLKLSDHTVKRHVANLLTKLNLSSRAAAAAYAGKEGLL